ncbi:hypothetical protein EHF_0890 [Ehrlichia japonica]|uniref:Uncharacterized protein n=1 Tax=Ehrlichia japonica TaxID=391036 RepID=X5H034_9RICK|nr:hypothetical protein EHF_0890 [Ehrlichia japonica]
MKLEDDPVVNIESKLPCALPNPPKLSDSGGCNNIKITNKNTNTNCITVKTI